MGEKINRKPYSKKGTYWKFYQISADTFFLQTYNKSRTPRAFPEELTSVLAQKTPIAYTAYHHSAKKGFVTTYLINCSSTDLQYISVKKKKLIEIRQINQKLGKDIDDKFNIISQHIDLGTLTDSLIQILRDDIQEFCTPKKTNDKLEFKPKKKSKKKKPKPAEEPVKHYSLVERIQIEPRITLINPGKNGLVREGKKHFHDICMLDIGLNFSKGCISTITPEGFYDPGKRCSYCYAHQNGPSYLDTVFDFDEKTLIEGINKKVEEINEKRREKRLKIPNTTRIRIAQNVEANTAPIMKNIPGFRDNLKIALNALATLSKERKITGAMPIKVIQYDKELAKLYQEAKISLIASVGYEKLEEGIVSYGFTTKKRLNEILKYAKEGVNAGIYVQTDITRGLDCLQDEAKMALDFFEKHKEYLWAQFLDMRITKKKDAEIIGGMPWAELINLNNQKKLFIDQRGDWRRTGSNNLCANHTHPDFFKAIGKNNSKIRLCSTHVVEEEQRCGKCFMDEE